jgi:hypothetical protein
VAVTQNCVAPGAEFWAVSGGLASNSAQAAP